LAILDQFHGDGPDAVKRLQPNLWRDITLERRVTGVVDLTPSAGPQCAAHLVRADAVSSYGLMRSPRARGSSTSALHHPDVGGLLTAADVDSAAVRRHERGVRRDLERPGTKLLNRPGIHCEETQAVRFGSE